MKPDFENQDFLKKISEAIVPFLEGEGDEFQVNGENELTDYMLVRPGSAAYQKLVDEKFLMFPHQDELGNLVFWYPISPEV